MERSLASVCAETLEAAQAQLDAARQARPETLADATASRQDLQFELEILQSRMPCKWTPILRMWSAVSGR